MDLLDINKKKVINALLATFPNSQSLLDFEKQDYSIANQSIPLIIDYAFKEKIIPGKSKELLQKFLDEHKKETTNSSPAISFNELIENLCTINSVNTFVFWLNNIAEQFNMPKIQPSMITRLRTDYRVNTVKKRCVIRIIAFWLGKTKPEFGWNYESLLNLPRQPMLETNLLKEKEGVVIAFNLQGHGDIIEKSAVDWLQKELPRCIDDLKLSDHISRKNLETLGVTSMFLKLPKSKGPHGEPRLYSQAIRDSIALGHQMTIRWLLSPYSSQKRVINISIYAGQFQEANLALQPLLLFKSIQNPMILLADFAHLCAEVADVKVAFQHYSSIKEIGQNHQVSVWAIKYMWLHSYYDFVPQLLKKTMLPTSFNEYRNFQQEINYPSTIIKKTFDALTAIDKTPQNTILLMEIAKVLLARRMYSEADLIIGNILRIQRHNVVARTMRMSIYANMAIEKNEIFFSEMAFNRAVAEGEYLIKYCDKDEEVWCEYGRVYYKRALFYFRIIRQDKLQNTIDSKQKVLWNLKKAEKCFMQGMTVSATGRDNRCFFYINYIRSFITLLIENPDYFDPDKRLIDTKNIYFNTGIKCFTLIGFTAVNIPEELEIKLNLQAIPEKEAKNIITPLLAHMKVYENSVLSRTFLPNVRFALAAMLWDFTPYLTVGLFKQILFWLEQARIETEILIPQKLAIYSFVLEQHLSPEKFISIIDETYQTLKKLIPNKILQQHDKELIETSIQEKRSQIKIILLHIDKPIETGILK